MEVNETRRNWDVSPAEEAKYKENGFRHPEKGFEFPFLDGRGFQEPSSRQFEIGLESWKFSRIQNPTKW